MENPIKMGWLWGENSLFSETPTCFAKFVHLKPDQGAASWPVSKPVIGSSNRGYLDGLHWKTPRCFKARRINGSSIRDSRCLMWVFPKIVGFPSKIIYFNRVFHYKPSILGYPYFWKHPCWWNNDLYQKHINSYYQSLRGRDWIIQNGFPKIFSCLPCRLGSSSFDSQCDSLVFQISSYTYHENDPFSHNHGSGKITPNERKVLLEIHPFFTPMILGARVAKYFLQFFLTWLGQHGAFGISVPNKTFLSLVDVIWLRSCLFCFTNLSNGSLGNPETAGIGPDGLRQRNLNMIPGKKQHLKSSS